MEIASTRPDTIVPRKKTAGTGSLALLNICAGHGAMCGAMPAWHWRHSVKSRVLRDASSRNATTVGRRGDSRISVHFGRRHSSTSPCRNDADRGVQLRDGRFARKKKRSSRRLDTTVVRRLERSIDSGRPETTAHRLEQNVMAAERETDSMDNPRRYRVGSKQLRTSTSTLRYKSRSNPAHPQSILAVAFPVAWSSER